MNFKFAKRVDVLFECVLDVLEQADQGHDPDYQQTRAAIISELQQLDLTLGRSETWQDDWALARYAMIVWIDEVLVHGCAWPAADRWSTDLLEAELCGTDPAVAGAEFFEKADQAKHASRLDALEVFYLTVLLGFRGSWRNQHDRMPQEQTSPKLKEWLTATFADITAEVDTASVPAETVPGPGAEPLSGRFRLLDSSAWLLMLTTAVLTLLPAVRKQGGFSEFLAWVPAHWPMVATLTVPVILVPLALRKFIASRMQRMSVRHPDIQAAWDAGLRELNSRGFDLHNIPLYLVAGTPDAAVARSVMASSGIPFDMQGLPEGDGPLLWFASRHAIFLACPGAGQVSLAGHAQHDTAADIDIDVANLEATRRLRAVCRLLRRFRRPDCGINGLLSFLPQHVIGASDESAAALQSAVAADNRIIALTLQQRSHVIIMVGGMEQQSGFLKLVQRFGTEVCERNRIGKGLPSAWCTPTPDTMDAVVHKACRAVEDNVYQLFRRDHNLEAIGNGYLYRLVCRSRHEIYDHLGDIVRESYLSAEAGAEFSLPVSGLYFAATGQRPDHQAFSVSVFRKLTQCAKLVDWHPAARETNAAYHRISRMLQLTAVLIAVISVVLLLI